MTGGCDSLVKVWRSNSQEASGWQEEAKLEGHSDWVAYEET